MINFPSPLPHLKLIVNQMNYAGRDQPAFDMVLALTFSVPASCLLWFLSICVSVYIIWNNFAMWCFFLMISLKYSINLVRNFTKVSNSSSLWKTNAKIIKEVSLINAYSNYVKCGVRWIYRWSNLDCSSVCQGKCFGTSHTTSDKFSYLCGQSLCCSFNRRPQSV